jgi:hypothetical protein
VSEIIEKKFTVPDMKLSEFHFPGNPIVPGMWTLKKITELIGLSDFQSVDVIKPRSPMMFGEDYTLSFQSSPDGAYDASVFSEVSNKPLFIAKGIRGSSQLAISESLISSQSFIASKHVAHALEMSVIDYNGYIHFHKSLCDYIEGEQVDAYLELDALAQIAICRFSRFMRLDIKLDSPPPVMLVGVSNLTIKKHLRYGAIYDSKCRPKGGNENKKNAIMLETGVLIVDNDTNEPLVEADIKGMFVIP